MRDALRYTLHLLPPVTRPLSIPCVGSSRDGGNDSTSSNRTDVQSPPPSAAYKSSISRVEAESQALLSDEVKAALKTPEVSFDPIELGAGNGNGLVGARRWYVGGVAREDFFFGLLFVRLPDLRGAWL